jgi:MATE family multidrug resistance protein
MNHIYKQLIKLAWPIFIGQLGLMLINVGDALVASRYDTHTSAVLGVALGFSNPIYLFGVGFTMAISVLMSILRGGKEETEKFFVSNIVFSFLLSLVCMVLMQAVIAYIPYSGIEAGLVADVQLYIRISLWSFPFAMIFYGIKEFLQSFENVWFANIVAMLGVGFNLVLDYIFLFVLDMGVAGLGWTSFFTRLLLLIVMLIYCRKYFKQTKFYTHYFKNLVQYGFPIGFTVFLEVFAFSIVSVFAGMLSVTEAATNNIVLNIGSASFMLPFAISSALAVKVGHSYGEQNWEQARAYTFKGLKLVTFLGLGASVTYLILREQIMGFFSQDLEVIKIGSMLFFIVAFFQVFDGLQIGLAGILRGYKITRATLITILIGHWGLAIPLGYYLCFHQGYRIYGLWIGLCLGLVFVSVVLMGILLKLLKKH